MTVAPRSFGFHHPAKTDRMALGHVRTFDDNAIRVRQISCWNVVAPPLPNDVPKLGTVAECHIRAWFST